MPPERRDEPGRWPRWAGDWRPSSSPSSKRGAAADRCRPSLLRRRPALGESRDVLETERLRLRPFTPDDVENLVELDSDPQVMRYINGGRPTPREEIERR